ncbi:MAG: helix-hairpin-helix domain-containing protein [Verrucomicrobiales bacterium]|nr:helix-hairpin-helix domain-containing protein [Verrucomicrobiales bacterium]
MKTHSLVLSALTLSLLSFTCEASNASELEDSMKTLSPAQSASLMRILNEGSLEELRTLPGVEKVKASTILEARPFEHINELMLLHGFGEKTVYRLVKGAMRQGY